MALRRRDTLAILTLLYAGLVVVVVGVDAWILSAWLLSGAVALVLGFLAFLLQREFRARVPGPGGNRLVWCAAAVAAFLSCTLAAGLVRRHGQDTLNPLFTLLGLLMLLSVVLARLAYHPDGAGRGRWTPHEKDRNG